VTEKITREIFDHLVGLAALELEDDEAEYLRRELNGQLKAIVELESIAVEESTPITSHGVDYTPEISQPLRDDQIEPCLDADAILAQAPQVEDRYFVVPDIPHEDLA
jgi:aspartyl-tRNA(Asn)/glutamyl-tRNA(Gln) amidotransferase subunit C